jgi:hypothetical protein
MLVNGYDILKFINEQIQEVDELMKIYETVPTEKQRLLTLAEIKEVHIKYRDFISEQHYDNLCIMAKNNLGGISFQH